MKASGLFVFASVMLFGFLFTQAYAQEVKKEVKTASEVNTQARGQFFVDANEDGVCDNIDKRGTLRRGLNGEIPGRGSLRAQGERPGRGYARCGRGGGRYPCGRL